MKTWLTALAFVLFAVALRAQSEGALEKAIESGDVARVREALDAGANPNGGSEASPQSPLTFAILKHAPDPKALVLVKLLVSREADVNQAADLRPLYAAILKGDEAVASFLVGAGADADVAGCVRATLPGTKEGESAKALAGKKGGAFPSITKGARTAPAKEPRKKELKRSLACED